VQQCASCALLYKTSTLTPDQFTEYYARTDFHKWELAGFHPPERLTLKILRTLHRGARILDFGCSSGRLLAPLVSSYECVGYEINDAAAREARRKGLSVLSAHALAATRPNSFDAVVMMNIFEHLLDPLTVLARLTKLLRPGGSLIIMTGNGGTRACRRDPAQFWYFRNLEHVIMMTRGHADWLAERLGLRLSRWLDICYCELPYSERILQYAQHVAYWQFRTGSTAVKALLRLIPRVRRAEGWPLAPRFTAGRDHVVAMFRKSAVPTEMAEHVRPPHAITRAVDSRMPAD
jgi:SAM-dependent methyltransferase